MRFVAASAVVITVSLSCPFARAGGIDEKIPDSQLLIALEARASQASPKEQCFLYAEIVHDMTEIAGKQFSEGDIEHASATLKMVREYADKIHMGMANDTKRLKNAEILVRHTAFRLKDILQSASIDDRPTLNATLKQLDQVQSELMMQVFQH